MRDLSCKWKPLNNDYRESGFVQSSLCPSGHRLETTAIYTHVAIFKLKAIHEATHPARLHRRPATTGEQPTPDNDAQRQTLLDALDREAEAEHDDER